MTELVFLRASSIPRFAMRRDEAAASLAISPTLFDEWVRLNRMPKGHKIGGVKLWDTQEIQEHWWKMKNEDDSRQNPFDSIVA